MSNIQRCTNVPQKQHALKQLWTKVLRNLCFVLIGTVLYPLQAWSAPTVSQTISFSPNGSGIVSAFATLNATASSGLTVSLVATTPGTCQIFSPFVLYLTTGTCTITANQAGDATYLPAPEVIANIVISKADQVIAFNPSNTDTVANTIALSASASSGLAVVFSTVSSACSINGSTVSYLTVGSCVIRADQVGDASYNAAPQVSVTITISKADQTISFNPSAGNVGASVSLIASASSGLSVALATASAANICTLSNGTVTYTGVGICTITADQVGDARYNAAPQVSVGIAVNSTNIAPVATNTVAQTDIDQSIQGILLGSDANGDALVFSIAQTGTLGNIVITDVATGAFTYTPQVGVTGTDSLTFQVDDVNGAFSTAALTVTILSTNKVDTLNLGDVNGDGLDDMGIVEIDNSGAENILVKSAVDGVLISTVPFGNAFGPLGQTVLPDIDGNSIAEIAVIGIKVGGTTVRANIKDTLTGNFISNVYFNSNQAPILLKSIADISGNGAPELLLLGTAVNGSGVIKVQVKDSVSGAKVGAGILYFGHGYDARGFEVFPDMNGNGVPEIGVMGRDSVTGYSRIQIRDLSTGVMLRQNFFNSNVNWNSTWLVKGMKQMPDMDGNGYPELAIASVNPTANNAITIQVMDPQTDAILKVIFYGNKDTFIDFEVVSDTNGNGFPELAVLGVNKINGTVRVQSKDASTRALLYNSFPNKNFAPSRLIVLGDLNFDNKPELGVFGANANQASQVQIRSAAVGANINTVTMP